MILSNGDLSLEVHSKLIATSGPVPDYASNPEQALWLWEKIASMGDRYKGRLIRFSGERGGQSATLATFSDDIPVTAHIPCREICFIALASLGHFFREREICRLVPISSLDTATPKPGGYELRDRAFQDPLTQTVYKMKLNFPSHYEYRRQNSDWSDPVELVE